MTLLNTWNDQQKKQFRKKIVTFSHNLASHDLFSDDAIISLLESHPHELLDVNTIGPADHPFYPNKHLTVDFRETNGKDLLDAAKQGRIFISIRNALMVHPDYKDIRDEMFAELDALTGYKTPPPTGTLLISSPTSVTPYHFDKKEVVLWHLRGRKRLYVYPAREPFISNEHFESVVSSFGDDLPYRADYDDHAECIMLEPGQAISWPLNAPHRVENETFCLSINTEYSTIESIMKIANMTTNATLRNRFKLDPSFRDDPYFVRALKTVSGQFIKRTSLKHDPSSDPVMYKLDPSRETCLKEIEPFERNF